jgi:hypothetical protein
MEKKPKGVILRRPKAGGGYEYPISGDTSTKNREYYEEQIEDMKEEDGYGGELLRSIKTATERSVAAEKADPKDPEVEKLNARIEHLKTLSEERKKNRK